MSFLNKKQKSEESLNLNETSLLPDAPPIENMPDWNNFQSPGLPDLPPLPDLPDSQNIQPLPALPSNDFADSFEIEAIKSSVSGDLNQTQGFNERRAIELPSLPERNTKLQPIKLPIQQKLSNQKTTTPAIHHPPLREPVFVKLDKFKMSYEKFQEIKMKVSAIENYLIKAKNVKEKEEQEIKAWEEELKNMKTKISEIDYALFSRV